MQEIHAHKSRRDDPGPVLLADHDRLGPGGVTHRYIIEADYTRNPAAANACTLIEIPFQFGGVPDHGVNGVTVEALIAICIDRLTRFQAGPFKCQENHDANKHLWAALHSLHERTRNRYRRGVEGKDQP